MSEIQKNDERKNKKSKFASILFKYVKDEDFLKSSSEEILDSVSFKKEIKENEENDKRSNKKILYI